MERPVSDSKGSRGMLTDLTNGLHGRRVYPAKMQPKDSGGERMGNAVLLTIGVVYVILMVWIVLWAKVPMLRF